MQSFLDARKVAVLRMTERRQLVRLSVGHAGDVGDICVLDRISCGCVLEEVWYAWVRAVIFCMLCCSWSPGLGNVVVIIIVIERWKSSRSFIPCEHSMSRRHEEDDEDLHKRAGRTVLD